MKVCLQDDEKRKDPHLFHDPHPQRKVGRFDWLIEVTKSDMSANTDFVG